MPKPRKTIFNDGYREIIAGLVARRQFLRITQAELATAFGEDQSFISRVERGQRRLDVFEYAVLCELLGVEPDAYLTGTARRAGWQAIVREGSSGS
jgi:transcriptional regulator with XRE-family HTH domain